jgi:hypothetical protein
MATLTAIRDAIKATVAATLPSLTTYDTVPETVNVPALIVMPQECDFDGAFGRGMDTWTFELVVLVSRVAVAEGQDLLDSYLTGGGTNSVREVFYNNSSLGLTDGTFAHMSGVRGYGGSFDAANLKYLGAILRLVVRTPGT